MIDPIRVVLGVFPGIWPIDLGVKLVWNMFQHQNIKNWPYYAIDIMIQTLSVRIICLFVCQSQIPSLCPSDYRLVYTNNRQKSLVSHDLWPVFQLKSWNDFQDLNFGHFVFCESLIDPKNDRSWPNWRLIKSCFSGTRKRDQARFQPWRGYIWKTYIWRLNVLFFVISLFRKLEQSKILNSTIQLINFWGWFLGMVSRKCDRIKWMSSINNLDWNIDRCRFSSTLRKQGHPQIPFLSQAYHDSYYMSHIIWLMIQMKKKMDWIGAI